MIALIAGWPTLKDKVARIAADTKPSYQVSDVHLLAPVPRPQKILAIGLNYADHIAESGAATPERQIWFSKLPNAVNGPYDSIQIPKASNALDYEGEMAIVIGKRCRHVRRARSHDRRLLHHERRTVRDVQMRTPTWTMGKSFDTHGPLGPWLTTADEVGDPHALELRTFVNGELRQHSNTRELLFDCYALIEHLTSAFTLEPGECDQHRHAGRRGHGEQAAARLWRGMSCASRSTRSVF